MPLSGSNRGGAHARRRSAARTDVQLRPAPEQRVPADHPLRPIRAMVDDVLRRAVAREFDAALRRRSAGRRSRPRSCCGPCCCRCSTAMRSERLLMEQLDYNLLFRWFVGPEHG